ncbi:MAG TPA: GNAT family N-acetyltransferase [Rhizomicrobium sp.]|nr:GNAT family N-acetyltransferase [Rhizomicrobium sp.]
MPDALRPATEADVPTLAQLHASSFAKGWTEEAIRQLLTSPRVFGLMSEDGFILARVAAGEAEILTIAVQPSARRVGLGRRLVITAAGQAARNGAQAMFLEVVTVNAPARALYESLGFAEVGRRKAYFEGQDALVLKAGLPLCSPRLGIAAETD